MATSFMSSSSSPYRDRTSEFNAVLERLKMTQSLARSLGAASTAGLPGSLASASTYSEFTKKASKVGLGIHEASKRVSRLATLAKRSSMFDDPAKEIQDLIALLKQDLTTLNASVSELESVQVLQNGDVNSSKHSIEHSKMVMANLKGRLMKTTSEFKEVLTIRTENLKLHENRKQLFTATASSERGNLFAQKPIVQNSGTDKTANSIPPPWANNVTAQLPHLSRYTLYGTSSGTQLRRRTGGVGLPLMQTQVQMEQEAPQHHVHGRSSALQNVESTITELSGMFTQLATMVSQHEELAIRIDDNMDDTLVNVEGAQGNLLKYMRRVSSNRWLILKIFFVLIAFLLVIIIFIS